jgi:hypothetical protein
VAVKVTILCIIDCFVCQHETFVNNPLDAKENYEHALDFAIHLSRELWIPFVFIVIQHYWCSVLLSEERIT